MSKKILIGLVAIFVLSLSLAACGDEAPAAINFAPYPGAEAVTLSDTVTAAFTSSFKEKPEITSYKTKDTLAKVKTHYEDQFKKDGWSNLAGNAELTSSLKQLEGLGAIAVLQQKGSTGAFLIGYPPLIAKGLGVQGITTENIFLVVKGKV